MHRTQILLEDWQYQALRARAQSEDRSLSELVREIIGRALEAPQQQKSRLQRIEGIGEDASAYGKDHDRFLYGSDDD